MSNVVVFSIFVQQMEKSKSQSQKSRGKTSQKLLVLDSLLCLWQPWHCGSSCNIASSFKTLPRRFCMPHLPIVLFYTSISVDYAVFCLFVEGDFV